MNERTTILVVDDDQDFVEAVRALLEKAGHRVVWARDGEQGLRRARSERPDLVVLDVMMTERTEGFFVLQEMRREPDLRDLPVIVVSSIYAECASFRVTPEADWMPADLFLPKPVEPGRLLAEVSRLVGKKTQGGER